MKKRIVRITAALCAAALLAGCGGSISSKDGGYYTTEAAAQDRCAIARIQPDECWHMMEDR